VNQSPNVLKLQRTFFLLLALLSLCNGCVLVSLHSTRPVQVRVTERETAKPVTGASLKIRYGYTGYGVVWVLRVPESASAQTDEQGIAILPMADFFQNINFTVNGERFGLDKELIRRGGYPPGGYWGGKRQMPDGRPKGELIYHPSPMVVQLTPVK